MTTAPCRHPHAEYSPTLRARFCPDCRQALKGNKFGAKPVLDGGERFDSGGEHQRWLDLQVMERGGLIYGLRRQVQYSLDVGAAHICDYYCDAWYIENGRLVVEDFKSKATRTAAYRLKKRLMKAIHGITIREVTA